MGETVNENELTAHDRRILEGETDFRFAKIFDFDQGDDNLVLWARVRSPQGIRLVPISEDSVTYDPALDGYVIDLT